MRLYAYLVTLAYTVAAADQNSTISLSGSTTIPSTASATEPCALVSSASTAWASAHPSALSFQVDATTAEACLQSVPLVVENATSMLDGLEAFWSFHSTLAWLKNPPSTYTLPPVDLMGGLTAIRDGLQNGTITREYQFQAALKTLIWQAGDGHLDNHFDLLSVFQFITQGGPVVSISEDGHSLPLQYYSQNDLAKASTSANWTPSPITLINGLNATDYFASLSWHYLFADPDAQWNNIFFEIANIDSDGSHGYTDGIPGLFLSANTTITYANGTVHQSNNMATSSQNFDGVDSGQAFYDKFCTPSTAANSATATNATSEALGRSDYPNTTYVDVDGTIAGYFLGGPYNDTAVLSIFEFATTKAETRDTQQVMTDFLEACRNNSKTKLIIDVSSNNGGDAYLSFDYFKQLFPTLAPYNTQVARAHPAYNFLGSIVSSAETQYLNNTPSNTNNFAALGGGSEFDNDTFISPNGANLTWPELYGPEEYHGDNFTNLFSRRYYDPRITIATSGIVVSGYGTRSTLPPQAFRSEDMVVFSDGSCDSACALFVQWLKWQGKVKQIAIGGRPQEGPMQAVGGTRGSQNEDLSTLLKFTAIFGSLTPSQLNQANQTELGSLKQNGPYLSSRSPLASLNLFNHVAQDDFSLTPIQFTYEAADCRIFWTRETVSNITVSWARVSDVWQGGFSDCVAGSTGQPSSLSGNATLLNNGIAANVSASEEPANTPVLTATSSRVTASNDAGRRGMAIGSLFPVIAFSTWALL